jgi:hypothetical protein
MTFKQEFLAALHSGQDHRALLDIVRRHHASLPARESYDQLEQIWLGFGFHKTDETSSLRDELEYVMERVWYYGPNID